jgi:transposase, IS5 family
LDSTFTAKDYMARAGHMADATIVPVPEQRNSADENGAVKARRIPKSWTNKSAKLRQKDRDAHWTKKKSASGSVVEACVALLRFSP